MKHQIARAFLVVWAGLSCLAPASASPLEAYPAVWFQLDGLRSPDTSALVMGGFFFIGLALRKRLKKNLLK